MCTEYRYWVFVKRGSTRGNKVLAMVIRGGVLFSGLLIQEPFQYRLRFTFGRGSGLNAENHASFGILPGTPGLDDGVPRAHLRGRAGCPTTASSKSRSRCRRRRLRPRRALRWVLGVLPRELFQLRFKFRLESDGI